MIEESPNAKWNRALRFILDEMATPNERLRELAHEKEFYHEYLWIRDSLIEHAHTLWRRENV
jgi:hypothetical protein